jgi:UDP-glucose:(heptosyl)LPS alpha-1,3-glucosyltransferase
MDEVQDRGDVESAQNQGRRQLRLHEPASQTDPKYRLAFAIHRYFDYGGLERDLLRVSLACADQGHEVHVLTSGWDGPQPAGVEVHLLPLRARTNHGRSREFAESVQRFVRQNQFDCLVGFNKLPGLDVYWCGDPCLAEHLRQTKSPLVRWLARYRTYLNLEAGLFGTMSDAELLVLCEPEKERIVRHYQTAESRLHLLPAGIDRRRFQSGADERERRMALRKSLDLSEEDIVVLMVGSSFKRKGVDRAIEALASLPHSDGLRTRLIVVGKDDAAPFQRLAKRHNVAERVHFAGGRPDAPDFYRSADFFVHPARQETAGHTLLEAMVCGLPVLTTAACGYAFHVERGGAGLVCPEPFVQRTLNSHFREMLSVAARREWKQSALAYCRATDLYSMVNKTVDVILSRAQRNKAAA